MSDANRLKEVVIDEAGLAAATPDIAHERRIAVFDLCEKSDFAVPGAAEGPYALTIGIREGRMALNVKAADGAEAANHQLSLTPLRRLMRDYFKICDSYNAALRDATPSQIEAIDMGRRGLHNEGAELMTEALAGKIEVDFETARRLFTLLCAIHPRT